MPEAVQAESSLPKVVLVGDSIRLSYASKVEEALHGEAVVISPKANGGDSSNVLKRLEQWVIREQPDVVHFNCGIHDTKKFKSSGAFQVSAEQYEANLREIINQIRAKTNATVLFATTTPILDERAAKTRSERDYTLNGASVAQFNAIALKVMQELNVPVNDLNAALSEADQPVGTLIGADGVHLTPSGRDLAGRTVAEFIQEHLETSAEK
ncbi:Lysophospholipase L1-like esterase [Durusdinium trenchii]|uniref:Lysophospholipase L1-like esterase n=1 Tax=Durusdinium trenchii TaxID=1381693 RepID=A0ABP0I2S5_9DINO